MQEKVKDFLDAHFKIYASLSLIVVILRCTYCMPAEVFGPDYAFLKDEFLLTFDEIERLAKVFVSIGVRKIRLTGGEPLLRKDLTKLIERLVKIEGLVDIGLTTNAIHLTKQAKALKEAGLHRVNVSLDAIDDHVFREINGRNMNTKPVLKGIMAAKAAGLEVKVNMVVKKGMNDHQVLPVARILKNKESRLDLLSLWMLAVRMDGILIKLLRNEN